MSISTALVIAPRIIGEHEINTVNARKLHAWLGVGKKFSDWVKDRIEKYGFTEGEDFLLVEDLSSPNLGSSKSRPQRTLEYHISTDMAKELAMVENNAKGREARRYFIEVEKAAKAPKTRLQKYEEILAAALYYRDLEEKRSEIMDLVMPANLHLYGTVARDGKTYSGIRRATVTKAVSRLREASELHVKVCQMELHLLEAAK